MLSWHSCSRKKSGLCHMDWSSGCSQKKIRFSCEQQCFLNTTGITAWASGPDSLTSSSVDVPACFPETVANCRARLRRKASLLWKQKYWFQKLPFLYERNGYARMLVKWHERPSKQKRIDIKVFKNHFISPKATLWNCFISKFNPKGQH